MRYDDIPIHSIGELIAALGKQITPGEITWFRGQGKAGWPLVPSLARAPEQLKAETALIKRFIQNAVPHLGDNPPKTDWEWIFLMQHHRVPTRLLDWTEAPLVALYFAVTAHSDDDGALWCLNPLALNREAHLRFRHELELPAFDRDEVLDSYLPNRVYDGISELNPIAAIGPRSSKRMAAQLGTFTINHRTHAPIEEVGARNHVWRMVIPSEAKSTLAQELTYLSYSELTLFPDLDRVAKIAVELLR